MKDNLKTKSESCVDGFTVIMPTYNQSGYIRNAIRSLFEQTYTKWELIIVNDGCTDNTEDFIKDYLCEQRVRYYKNDVNQGLGYSINIALNNVKYQHIAYLPSDDFYFPNHLQVLSDIFKSNDEIVLVTTAIKSEIKDSLIHRQTKIINGLPVNYWIQLVQTAHKKTEDKWTERTEWVSEDLYKTFWYKLTTRGLFVSSEIVTCQWTIHPAQRHKIMSESFRGHINRYRQYYKVNSPIKMIVSDHKIIDEKNQYASFLNPDNNSKENKQGLKILLVGELSYNPERICALEEAGHQLYGLWTQSPAYSFSNVGPLPFGNIIDIDYEHWEEEIDRVQPDVIYALLNFCAVPIAYEVIRKCKHIPFVWHFKEGPFLCFEHELWNRLIYLYAFADGVIFLNKEIKTWYRQYIPEPRMSMVLDGDLPKQDYFKNCFSSKLSSNDGEVHTVVPGRMIGITVKDIKELSERKIHIHLYTESYENSWSKLIKEAQKVAPDHFHVHHHCDAINWTREFSKYDAGWLHCFESKNCGRLDCMGWNDLNIPARVSTMMAAAIPCIQKDNGGHIVAMQSCLKDIDCGLFFNSIEDLANQLYDKERMKYLHQQVMLHRMSFSFDSHVFELIDFFKKVIEYKKYK